TSAKASSNYGSTSALRTDLSPAVVRSYVRFDVSGLSTTPSGVTLRLYANSNDSAGLDIRTASTSWSEMGITYSNSPAPGAVVASTGQVTNGTWISVDVTS